MKKTLTAVLLGAVMVSCGGGNTSTSLTNQNQITTKVITKPEVKLTNKFLQPEVLWYMGRVGNVKVSPNGKLVAYTVTWYSIEENKSNSDIYIMDVNGENKKQLTATADREGALQWRPDGQYIGFTRNGQVYEIKPDGSDERKVSDLKLAVSEFLYAPSSDKMLFTIDTKISNTKSSDVYPDMPKSNAYIADDLMYRHWDTYADGNFSHVYYAAYADGKTITEAIDIMPNEPYDAPLKPFGGLEDITFSPDGKTIAYTCKKLKGKEYAMTTNSNIYLYTIDSKETTMLTEGMFGYDRCPKYSPDGTKLMWLSMEREGYEADKERIFIYDFVSGKMNDYSRGFDSSPSDLEWAADGKSVYLTACFDQTYRVFRMDISDPNAPIDPAAKIDRFISSFTQISKDGLFDYQSAQMLADGSFIVTRTDMTHPTEIYKLSADGEGTELSFINKDITDQLELPVVDKRYVKTTDNKDLLVWVITPPNFDKSKKHPVIMMCTGGPQGPVSQAYSYRWNMGLMASQGYVVVYPARRGVSGNGQEWADAVSKDHGGQPERDLLSAIDNIAKEPWVDANRLGAAGASYGGFSIFWLEGNHNKRFKALFAHCGIFDFQSMYSTTEEMFFENWEKGGAFWDKNNAAAQKSRKQSPINFIDNWDTPLMVVHGEKDYRVPYTQGLQAYNIAQMKGVPSRLLIFPEENHWVLKPQNAIVWQREFFAWFDKYLKE